MNPLHTLLIVLALFGLGGCVTNQLGGGPIQGVVLDQTTHQPVPGAIVVARWTGTVPSWGGAYSVCYHVETAIADGEGRYHVSAWRSTESEKQFHSRITERVLYMDGYKHGFDSGNPPSGRPTLVYLQPFKGTARERMDLLHTYTGGLGCLDSKASGKNLRVFFRALYEEGKPLAKTKIDFFALGTWLKYSETFGDE